MDRSLSPKMLRETFCVAQTGIGVLKRQGQIGMDQHLVRLDKLIELMDLLRPVGNDGSHDDRHTAWCGCEDK